jgi:hypothetical protein
MSVRSRRSTNAILVLLHVWIGHWLSIILSAIRPGTEATFPRKQCGLFLGGLIDLVMLALWSTFMSGEGRLLSQLFEWVNQINWFLSEK